MTSRDIKKSNFVSQSTIPPGATFDFVINGTNIKIPVADMIAEFGTTGTLEQLGEVTGTPVLSKSGTVNRIRNVMGGSGVVSSVSPQNGIQLDHNFTVDETGVPIMKDKAATSPTLRSLIQGSGISIASVNGGIQIAVSETPVSTKTVIINQLSDFPTAVGGVITLDGDTQYFLTNDITTSNRFIAQHNTVIAASSPFLITLSYTCSGVMFTAVDSTFAIDMAIINCPNGTFLDLSSSIDRFLIISDALINCDTIGTISGPFSSTFKSSGFSAVTDGFTFSGSHRDILFALGFVELDAGTAIDLGSSTANVITLSQSIFELAAGATFLSGLPDSGNLNVGGFGSVFDNRIQGAGTSLNNITETDNSWQFLLNDKIQDTTTDGILSLTGNAITTTISVATTPVLIAGTWNIDSTSKFDGTAAGRLTYKGLKDIRVPITCTLTGAPISGTNKDITYHLFKNGVEITNAAQTNVISAGSPKNTSVVWLLKLSQDDYLELFVSNDTDTINVLITDAIFRVA